MKPFVTLAGIAMMLSLSACELRRDGDGEDASPSDMDNGELAGAAATPSPTPTTTPIASIIRDDAAPTATTVELPVQPVDMTLPFPDGSDITEGVERQLVGLLQEGAVEKDDWPVVLSGHTDSGGNDQANLRASRARAEAVAAWLVEHGVDDERIEVIAFGEQNPVEPNALADGSPNEEGRRANRRVEIHIGPPESEPTENTASDQDA